MSEVKAARNVLGAAPPNVSALHALCLAAHLVQPRAKERAATCFREGFLLEKASILGVEVFCGHDR
jgi:hypothetical protein